MLIQAKTVVDTFVRNKFIKSDYIKNRTKPATSPKYYEEEITYWVEKIINSNWSLVLFETEFDKTYQYNHSTSTTSIAPNDYIGQTFQIPETDFPNGMFLYKIVIYTAMEDTGGSGTVNLDIRQLINGVPSSTPFAGTMSNIKPHPFRVAGTTVPFASSAREFEFAFPIKLDPGWYCFTLSTSTSNYSVYISEGGIGTTLAGTKATANPYIGDYIYSGQGTSWVVDPRKDLCFSLIQAEFEVGTRNLHIKCDKHNYAYDILHFTMPRAEETPKLAYIESITATINESGTNNESTIEIIQNDNINMPTRCSASVDGVSFTLTLQNKDENLTPIIDLDNIGVTLAQYYIDKYTQAISDSELTKAGTAMAKYRTKVVTLNEGFDADGITVYVDVSKPEGASIEVFYRILNKYDSSVNFEDSEWYRLPQKTTTVPATLSSNFVEETYESLGISYTRKGVVYETFNQIAIKVVFYADDPSKVPVIKNLRVIATV